MEQWNSVKNPPETKVAHKECTQKPLLEILWCDDYQDSLHDTTLVVIVCTLQQSFPHQLLLSQRWGPCGILH
jgi:hypothetical protein